VDGDPASTRQVPTGEGAARTPVHLYCTEYAFRAQGYGR